MGDEPPSDEEDEGGHDREPGNPCKGLGSVTHEPVERNERFHARDIRSGRLLVAVPKAGIIVRMKTGADFVEDELVPVLTILLGVGGQ